MRFLDNHTGDASSHGNMGAVTPRLTEDLVARVRFSTCTVERLLQRRTEYRGGTTSPTPSPVYRENTQCGVMFSSGPLQVLLAVCVGHVVLVCGHISCVLQIKATGQSPVQFVPKVRSMYHSFVFDLLCPLTAKLLDTRLLTVHQHRRQLFTHRCPQYGSEIQSPQWWRSSVAFNRSSIWRYSEARDVTELARPLARPRGLGASSKGHGAANLS